MVLLLALFLISGATGLVYELVWTRELVFVFGGTTYAITTVLVAFMGGLGFGSWGSGRLARRIRRPGLVYGGLELFIGVYALLVPVLLELAEPLYRSLYPHVASTPWLLNAARFCVGALTLALPTIAMGATLPLLVKYATMRGGRVGQSVGLLYGINTLGATLGVLACGFLLLPRLGLAQTNRWAAAANVAIGMLALAFLRREAVSGAVSVLAAGRVGEPGAAPRERSVLHRRMVLFTCAASGFVAMAYQIAWTRTLVMSIGSSTYSFTCILAAFILGLALGSLAVARFVDRLRNPLAVIGFVQIGIGLSAAFVLPLQGWTPVFVYYLVESFADRFDLLLACQFGLIIAITFVPTFLLGLLFPLFARVLTNSADDAGAAAGRVYGVNTIGTILGSFLAGFVLLWLIGAHALILAGTLLNAAVGVWLLWSVRRSLGPSRWPPVLAGIAVVLIPLIGLTVGRWDPYVMSSGPFIKGFDPRGLEDRVNLIFYEEGVDLTASVTRAKADPGLLSLRVNAKTDASTSLSDMSTQLMLGHLPLLLHENPERVCVIGLGSGMTLGAVTEHAEPRQIDSVEISDAVISAAALFSESNHQALDDPRVDSIRTDGRNHLLLAEQSYDVIISVPSNPWISGVANLFTREYFALCGKRLRIGGRLAFWLQGYMMPVDSYKLILRTAAAEFEHVSLWRLGVSDTLIIAGDSPLGFSLSEFSSRMSSPAVRADLYRVGLGDDPGRMLGRFVASGDALRTWVGAGRLHTDDNALLEFSAPRTMFSVRSEKLSHALHELTRSPFDDLIAVSSADPVEKTVGIVDRMHAAGDRLDALLQRDLPDPMAVANELVGVYNAGPGDVNVYQTLIRIRVELERVGPSGDDRVPALLDSIDGLRVPSVAPRTTRTLADVTRMLMDHANAAGGSGRWNLAVDYWEEASALLPEDTHIAINHAVALMQAGRAADAVTALRGGVNRGLFTAEQVAQSKTFEPLHHVPGFDSIGE